MLCSGYVTSTPVKENELKSFSVNVTKIVDNDENKEKNKFIYISSKNLKRRKLKLITQNNLNINKDEDNERDQLNVKANLMTLENKNTDEGNININESNNKKKGDNDKSKSSNEQNEPDKDQNNSITSNHINDIITLNKDQKIDMNISEPKDIIDINKNLENNDKYVINKENINCPLAERNINKSKPSVEVKNVSGKKNKLKKMPSVKIINKKDSGKLLKYSPGSSYSSMSPMSYKQIYFIHRGFVYVTIDCQEPRIYKEGEFLCIPEGSCFMIKNNSPLECQIATL